jgi:hypothetical protein
MNNGTLDSAPAASHNRAPRHSTETEDELSKAKRELLQAEVRLAKARATIVTAEIDIKVLSARLKSLAK